MKKYQKLALIMSLQTLFSPLLVGYSEDVDENERINFTMLSLIESEQNKQKEKERSKDVLIAEEIVEQPVEIPQDEMEVMDIEIIPEEIEDEYEEPINQEIIEETIDFEEPLVEIESAPIEIPEPEISIVDKILFDDKTLGSYGRLYFNESSSVGLNAVSLNEGNAQEVVDTQDSAAIFNFGNVLVIADHKNQEFGELKNRQVGDTTYIKYENSIIDSYTCSEKVNGQNTGYELIMDDGRKVSELTDCDIVMYTCNENWQNVTITLWKKEPELKRCLTK